MKCTERDTYDRDSDRDADENKYDREVTSWKHNNIKSRQKDTMAMTNNIKHDSLHILGQLYKITSRNSLWFLCSFHVRSLESILRESVEFILI